MTTNLPPVLQYAGYISIALLLAGLAFTFLRLLKGPSIADRVVAVDLFSVFVMGVIIVHAFLTGLSIYLNAVFVMALISFIGTVAFARYLEKRASK
jgi:multicomponent Na+:H+ antiporter subunit F